jgi:hypothetical protein
MRRRRGNGGARMGDRVPMSIIGGRLLAGHDATKMVVIVEVEGDAS